MSQRKNDPEGVRSAILEACIELFSAHGFHHTSITQIAKRAGVTKSLLHHHFGNKADLWKATQHAAFDDYFNAQRHLILSKSTSDDTLLRESMRLYFDHFRARPDLIRLMGWMNLEMDASFEDVSEGLVEFAVERLAHAQRGGMLRDDVHPWFIMMAFFCVVEHWFLARRELLARHLPPELEGDGLDEAYIDALISIVLDGVRARAPKADPEAS